MTPEEIEKGILDDVIAHFVGLNQPIQRHKLTRKYEDFDVLDALFRRGVIRTNDYQTYFPTLAAFEFSGNVEQREIAKQGFTTVLTVLRTLYKLSDEKADFTFEQLAAQAKEMGFEHTSTEVLQLGMFLVADLGVLAGRHGEYPKVTKFTISERIVTLRDPELAWTQEADRYRLREPVPTGQPGDISFNLPSENEIDDGFNNVAATCSSSVPFDWSLIHPDIAKIAKPRFDSGCYADAIENSLKAVNQRVKEWVMALGGEEGDGASLMKSTFSPKNPILLLGDDTLSGQNMQLGYMEIFAGAMTGIRNPKAHGIVDIDLRRAIHFLFVASLLMFKLDEARPAKAKRVQVSMAEAGVIQRS